MSAAASLVRVPDIAVTQGTWWDNTQQNAGCSEWDADDVLWQPSSPP